MFRFILLKPEELMTVHTDTTSQLHIGVHPPPLRIDTLASSSLECRHEKRALPESLPA